MEPIKGKQYVAMFRLLSEKETADAKRPALLTENTVNISVSADATQTKDGVIRTTSEPEIELEITSVLAEDDAIINKIKNATLNGETIEAWSINFDKKGTGENSGKYAATYYQGKGTELEFSAPADGNVEVSFTLGVNGKGVDGFATVSQELLDEALYVFADTLKTGE
ncbi:phage major tail protein, TP901-1 family [Faecalibaculum rodentium]|uniref:phage major tail protein, TP901-1 family n=1 Tax=Faecalibaculum rodentium TaxID=1702221 RepID=UPI00272C3FC7|nr:phage major tail protein, TP901-1 family [Faecalibaculum rodentium]